MSKTHTVRTVTTITTEEPFLSIYNANRKMNDNLEATPDYTRVVDGVKTTRKTKVEIINMKDQKVGG